MSNADRRTLTVLTLEDEGMISMAIEDMLRDAGYAVQSVATSKQALDLLGTQQFDAAVLDIGLLDGDSHEVAEALSTQRIPYVLCTARIGPVDTPFLDAPILDKPFSESDLLASLAGLVAREQRA